MYVCMYVCMYVSKYVCMYVNMHVCMCICMHVCTYVYTYMYVCIYACMYIRIYVCMYACMYLYTYIRVCMYVCTVYTYVCLYVCLCDFPEHPQPMLIMYMGYFPCEVFLTSVFKMLRNITVSMATLYPCAGPLRILKQFTGFHDSRYEYFALVISPSPSLFTKFITFKSTA